MLAEIAVSVFGVAFLILVAWLLGATKSVVVTKESATNRLSFDEPDFNVAEFFISATGKSAAAISADGSETALVFAIGDGLGTRRFRHGAIGVEKRGNAVIFNTGEPSLGEIQLVATDDNQADQWILRLAGARL